MEIVYLYWKFYIKAYWSEDGIIEVILQSEDSEEVIESESQKKDGVKCKFYKSLEGLRLCPISLLSIETVSPLERSRHIFLGEAAALR